MNLLKRELAPILPEAWSVIDEEAKRVIGLSLAGRRLVSFEGPHGWQYAAVNTGRVNPLGRELLPGIKTGLRTVQPLVEVRVPFHLEIPELDAVAKGARLVDMTTVVKAAEKISQAEDNAIFNGFEEGGITGIIPASPHPQLAMPETAARYPQIIVDGREILQDAGVNGPYALALGPDCYKMISQAAEDGYPIAKRINNHIIDGPLVRVPALRGAVLLSMRGGDFELTVGQDISIGYASYEKDRIELYLIESFTFRILDPTAAVYLKPGS